MSSGARPGRMREERGMCLNDECDDQEAILVCVWPDKTAYWDSSEPTYIGCMSCNTMLEVVDAE